MSAPPYDVISPEEQERLQRTHRNNVIHITLGGEQPGDDDQSNRYTRAARLFRDWLESGLLVVDQAAHLYLYRSDFTAHQASRSTAGIVAALELEELGAGGVFGHEKTRPGPKADRLALMRTTKANLEPLWFFASRQMHGFSELVEELGEEDPLADVLDPQDVRHRVWELSDEHAAAMQRVIEAIPLVVADGHHRYETCFTYREERRATEGPGPWDATLALIGDPLQFAPEVLPIHRLVHNMFPSDLQDLKPFSGDFGDLLTYVQEAGPGTIGAAAAEGLWTLKSSGEVDTVWLAEQVLEPRGAEVTYEHDIDIVQASVRDRGDLAFLMAPVPVALVAEKALAGHRLPPKTTLFWPKPRTGLVMRDLESDS